MAKKTVHSVLGRELSESHPFPVGLGHVAGKTDRLLPKPHQKKKFERGVKLPTSKGGHKPKKKERGESAGKAMEGGE